MDALTAGFAAAFLAGAFLSDFDDFFCVVMAKILVETSAP